MPNAAHRAVGPYAMGPSAADLEIHTDPLDVIGVREVCRGATIALALLSTVVLASLRWLLRVDRGRWVDAVAVAVVDGFERLGPTFVKLGQLIASTSDVFPRRLAQACLHLLDDVAPVPAASVRAVIEADLGHPVEALFSAFDDIPLASGSVAQVHRCRLPDGREAVVKVQRPGHPRAHARRYAFGLPDGHDRRTVFGTDEHRQRVRCAA